jgi:hypothetical protein
MSEDPAAVEPAPGYQRLVRKLAWLAALLPLAFAATWASLGSDLPEPVAVRHQLGEATMQWEFADVVEVPAEPAQVITRALYLGVLHLPGATIFWTVAINVLLAAAAVALLAGLAKASFGLSDTARACAFGLAGLLVCSPSLGASWLHGERMGSFLVPVLVLGALRLLQGNKWFAVRGLLAIALAAAAPFCHTAGLVAFAAVLPALHEASRLAGGSVIAWMFGCTVIGVAAGVASLWPAGGLHVGESGFAGCLLSAPLDTLRYLMRTTGGAWLDPLPAATFDDFALGALSWLLPWLLWWFGDRSPEGRRRAAPWFGCVWFGLLVFVLQLERHGPGLPGNMLRELTLGAWLLPAGCVGLVAARIGRSALPVGAGVLLVLSVQDWHRGLEELRLARMNSERTAMQAALSASVAAGAVEHLAERDAADLKLLRDRCLVPPDDGAFDEALEGIANAAGAPDVGEVIGGDAESLRGVVYSSLTHPTVQCIVVRTEGAENGMPAPAQFTLPDYRGRGRVVPWTAQLDGPLAEGARVRAFGYVLPDQVFTPLGPAFVLRDGELVPVAQ